MKTLCVQKDNLALNDCIVGLEEKVLALNQEFDLEEEIGETTILPTFCLGHSIVLATKPVVERLDKLSRKLVRWPHTTECGNGNHDFEEGSGGCSIRISNTPGWNA